MLDYIMDQEKIGKLIAKLRKSKGLTQRELGDMVGVGFRAVSKWETGLTSPDISIINDLSKILGISADELLKGEVNKKETLKKSKSQNILNIIMPILLIIASIIIIIIIKNRPQTYDLRINESKYYIEGEITLKNNNVALKVNKLGLGDNEFMTTIIKNYQYEITCKNSFIFGYGYVPTVQALPTPQAATKWAEDFKINYEGKIKVTKKDIIKNGLNFKIIIIDNQDNQIIKKFKIKLEKRKAAHST